MTIHIVIFSAIGIVAGVGMAYAALCWSGEHGPSW